MITRPGFFAKIIVRFIAMFIVLFAVLWANSADAAVRQFSAQSLIIPMDMCYQPSSADTGWEQYILDQNYWDSDTPPVQPPPYPTYCNLSSAPSTPDDGVLKAYGLVYRLLQNGIKVYVILDQTKATIDAPDMTITTNAVGQSPVSLFDRTASGATGGVKSFYPKATATVASSISYRGSPFVIDASQHDQALTIIKSTVASGTIPALNPLFNGVDIHVANTLFNAPVRSVLSQTPPNIALMNIGSAAEGILTGYLTDAGLNTSDAVGTFPTIGTVYTQFNNPQDFIGGGLTTGNNGKPFKILWAPHFQFTANSMSPYPLSDASKVMAQIAAFVDGGGAFFSECASILNYEGGSGFTQYGTRYMTTAGLNANGTMVQSSSSNNWNRFPSFGSTHQSWTFSDPGHYLLQIGDFKLRRGHGTVANFLPANGSAYYSYVQRLITSKDTSTSANDGWDLLAYVPNKDNDPKKGPVIYFGGHTYGSQESSCSDTCGPSTVRTPEVAGERIVLNTMLFFGQDPTVLELTRSAPIVYSDGKIYQGSYVETNPAATAYPPVAGHFREYPPGALSGQTVTAFNNVSLTPDWDTANLIPAANSRIIYTVVPGSPSATQIRFTTANKAQLASSMGTTLSPDTTTAAVSGVLAGALGGVDHSIPAVIPASELAGSASRPTVAYFGALDGMLHAVLISGTSTLTSTPGTEMWAFIPPSQLGKIATYQALVDGSPQVADVFITDSTGRRNWHTLLAVTNGTGNGTVDVLDITNPDSPQWMWTASDTACSGGCVLGASRGAAWGRVQNVSGPEYALYVTTNNQLANGSTAANGSGLNVYSLDASHGTVLWRYNYTYIERIPGSGTPGTLVQNDVPPPPAVVSLQGDTGIIDSVFATDMDGNIWKLDAGKGTQTLIYPTSGAGTAAQGNPIETGVAIFRNSGTPHDLAVIGVTAGADWLPFSQVSKVLMVDVSTGANFRSMLDGTPISLPVGEHVYAAPTVKGDDVYIITSTGYFKGDIGGSYTDSGYLRRINLANGTDTQLAKVDKGASEVTVSADGSSVIGASDNGLTQVSNSGASTNGQSLTSTVQKPITVKAWINQQ